MAHGFLDKVSVFASELSASLKTLVRVSLKGRRPSNIQAEGESLVILGNGPSLRHNLEEDMDFLQHSRCMAVNFFANSEAFSQIKPRYYVLADPHFFEKADTDENVKLLIKNLRETSWEMTLFLPGSAKQAFSLFAGTKLILAKFNFLRADGFIWLENQLWKAGLGMPRPRNVLIPSLMIALRMGYLNIKVLGADHSWLATLSVTEDNKVVSVQPHFYKTDGKEEKRINAVYDHLRLDQVLESLTIAFRSYHSINRFARVIGAKIINATPGSMIDAFERGRLNS